MFIDMNKYKYTFMNVIRLTISMVVVRTIISIISSINGVSSIRVEVVAAGTRILRSRVYRISHKP